MTSNKYTYKKNKYIMVESKKDYKWVLIFIIPNLILKESFETEYMAIVPYDDKRLTNIRLNSSSAKNLLNNFKTVTGNKVNPPALIWRKNAPKTVRNNEAIVAFRNSFAISSLLYNCTVSVNSNSVFGPAFSDFFDFYPVTIGKKDSLHISSPALEAYGPSLDKFYGTIYPHLPYNDFNEAKINDFIADKIIEKWTERFISPGKDTWDTRLLFRSLEMAYQAMTTPFRNNSTIYDYGTNLSLWVSAFEILVHKKPGDKVGWRQVIEFLGKYRWGPKKLRGNWYNICKDKKKSKTIKGNLIQKLYMELNSIRNAILHGNQVTKRHLFPFQNTKRPPLALIVPTLYWVALSIFLPSYKVNKRSVEEIGKAIMESMNNLKYEEALLSSIGLNLDDAYR